MNNAYGVLLMIVISVAGQPVLGTTMPDMQECAGCSDDSEGPTEPGVLDFGSGETVTIVASVVSFNGGCWEELDPPPGHFTICTEMFPCTPFVDIRAECIGSDWFSTVWWKIGCGGTICNVGHPSGEVTGEDDCTLSLFSNYVAVNCGQGCPINTNYKVSCGKMSIGSSVIFWNMKWAFVGGSLHCQPCDSAI